jgi:hypothetical protein
MQEFIQSAASKLGINEDQAKSATGGVLNFLKQQGPGAETDTLISKIPGAEDVMQSTTASGESRSESGAGGMLGGLGGVLGGAGGALSALQSSGLDGGQAKQFVVMLVDYAKQKAGPERVEQVLDKVPALKSFLQ